MDSKNSETKVTPFRLDLKRGFFSLEVPLWVALSSLIVILILVVSLMIYNSSRFNYTIRVPGSEKNKPANLHYGAMQALTNADYFNKVKTSFIEQKTTFILADLSEMKLTLYSDGKAQKVLPILTKGKEGSWWETPAGIYKIETKEVSHFSSIGKVYQPWSMQFQGNFFIHGWPYYDDGTEVSSTYSGGCIRLSTEDAKIVYEYAKIGTPILVYEKDFGSDGFAYSAPRPEVTATGYLVADLKNDYVLVGKDTANKAEIGGLSKLVTGLVAAEYINLDKIISVSNSMLVPTDKPRLREGQSISIYDLMFPLLMESSNEAAEAISRQLGVSRFTSLMNDKARALGMTASNFDDPAGILSNTSTPEDLFALAKYLYNNRSFLLKISAGKITSSVYGEPSFKDLRSIHIPSVQNAVFVGGSIDTTGTQQSYVGILEMTIQNEKRPVAVIVTGSQNAFKDVATLVEYTQLMYR